MDNKNPPEVSDAESPRDTQDATTELTDQHLSEFLDLVAAELTTKTQFSKGTSDVSAADLKKLMPLIKHYAKMAHPWTSCFKDQVKHGLSEGHAKARCSVIKDLMKGSTRWRGEDDKKADTTLDDLGFDEDWAAEAAAALSGLTDEEVDAMLDAARETPEPGEVFVLDSALSPGDAVEWGEGDGKGRGIVMEQDTSTGNVNVHTCEVVTEGGAGEQLSPTGKTMKIDGAKLKKIALNVVGTEPVGPELRAASMSEVPDAARANAARGLYLGRESHPTVPDVAVALADGTELTAGMVEELRRYHANADLSETPDDDPLYLMHGGAKMGARIADLMMNYPEHRPPDIVAEDLMMQLENLQHAYRVAARNRDDYTASALHGLLKSTLDKIEDHRKKGDLSADDWGHAVGMVDGIPELVAGDADLASGAMFGGKKAPPFAKGGGKDKNDARKPAGGSKDGKLDTKKASALGKGDVVVLGSKSFEVAKVVKDGDRVKFWVDGKNKIYSYSADQTLFVRKRVDMSAADENPYADLSLQLPVVAGPAVPLDLAAAGTGGAGAKKKWIKQILPFAKINYKGRVLDFSKKFGEQLVANFKKKPFDQVPFFKVDKDNRHNSDPDNFRGELSDLMLKDDGVYAVVETNEQGTEHLTKVNPKLGTSVRVRFDWTRPADTKKYGPVLEHLAGTTLPHVPNLKPFQPVELSDAPDEPGAADGVLDLTGYEFSHDPPSGGGGAPGGPTSNVPMDAGNPEEKEVIGLTEQIDLSQVPEEMRPTIQALVDGKKTATDLAQAAMDRLQQAEERARKAEVESRLADMTNEGVPPFMVDLARPLLLDAEYGAGEIVVDMADDGEGNRTEVRGRRDEQVWKLLSGAKGAIRFGEQGSGANGGSADFAGGGKSPDDMSDDELFAAWQQLREGEGE